ncbi:sigma-54-dependent transcriptional regulator [Haliangium ochraceum]|uniref:Two component, sigma54 specific, transcriptional regulator, Fis family n=1 Tax=Haliangium ochraceum (strain DSM 14365 / JCM 11303 / SMP-2) TaxID=502025 RepID=D0LM71_HALO1|nr:sigma-54 dependent transcriptional regulator [Haliangium ochraceum]ACY16777.1 two component, sigma54 specific, transcriptional regulator, Fis family [Haliangium ochraceum DSM 14365]
MATSDDNQALKHVNTDIGLMQEHDMGRVVGEHRALGTILVIDDEEAFHDVLVPFLDGYRVLHAYSGWQASAAIKRHHVDVVLLDLNLPDVHGFKLIDELRAESGDAEVIILTAHSDVQNAVRAVKQGAFDFLAKTHENYQQIGEHIQRALLNRKRRREQIAASFGNQWVQSAFEFLDRSKSPATRNVMKLVRSVADTPLSVLIEGESGVGKEIVARYLHAHSSRTCEPFVAAHVAAMPAALLESQLFGHVKGAFTGADRAHVGKFELADGGTLFLDEVGELDGNAQVKLLRVLQEREVERIGAAESSPVNVRVVAATNKSLQNEVKAGRFRDDLFFRLNVIRIEMPPLRHRTEDLPALLDLLAEKHAAIMVREAPRFSAGAVSALQSYDWPGNIRELENLVMRLVAIHPGEEITTDDIPPEYCLSSLNTVAARAIHAGAEDGGDEQRLYFLAREQFERYLVRLMVNRHQGDKRAAARALGISHSTVKEKSRGEDPDWPNSV